MVINGPCEKKLLVSSGHLRAVDDVTFNLECITRCCAQQKSVLWNRRQSETDHPASYNKSTNIKKQLKY